MQCYVCSESCDYSHFNDLRRGGKAGNCPLFDSVYSRHDNEIRDAEEQARKQVAEEHPGVDLDLLRIQMSERVAQDEERRKKDDPYENQGQLFMRGRRVGVQMAQERGRNLHNAQMVGAQPALGHGIPNAPRPQQVNIPIHRHQVNLPAQKVQPLADIEAQLQPGPAHEHRNVELPAEPNRPIRQGEQALNPNIPVAIHDRPVLGQARAYLPPQAQPIIQPIAPHPHVPIQAPPPVPLPDDQRADVQMREFRLAMMHDMRNMYNFQHMQHLQHLQRTQNMRNVPNMQNIGIRRPVDPQRPMFTGPHHNAPAAPYIQGYHHWGGLQSPWRSWNNPLGNPPLKNAENAALPSPGVAAQAQQPGPRTPVVANANTNVNRLGNDWQFWNAQPNPRWAPDNQLPDLHLNPGQDVA